jgi:signal transduction histidine kinase
MSLKFIERIPKTIGFKLTLWYSGIFFLSSLILFALVYFTLSLSLQKKDREIILLELKECVAQYQRGGVDALQNEVEFEKHASGKNPFFVRLRRPANKTIFLNTPDQWANFDLKQLERRAIKDNRHWLYLTTMDSEDTFEVVIHAFPDGSLLEVGKSITSRKAVLKRFRAIFAGITIPMIFIGLVGGAFLSFRALRPIRYLINTIRLIIDTGEMESRMPTRKRGDELDELSILFNRMLEKIETLMKGMREGLDNVAHDLRTPMTRLKGVAEIALQSDQNIVVLRETLSDCLEQSERILTMLNTLMDVSEAETGMIKLNLEEVSIPNLIEEVVDLYNYVAEEKGISIETNLPKEISLTADRSRLRQVIANLLDNAIKYTPSGGRVDIEALQKEYQIVVTVRDTGIGITTEELPRIWNRLYRGDRSRHQRGLGLGLTLVKAIVQAHEGYIEVSSEPGAGSLFVVHLPKKL